MDKDNALLELDGYGDQNPTRAFYKEGLKSFLDLQKVKGEMERYGMGLYPWQEMVLRNSLSVSDGKLYYVNIGLSVPRQNGKSEIIVWRIFIGILFLKEKVLYTSYNKDSARSIYRRMQDLVEGSPELSNFIEFGDQHNKMELRARDPRTGEELGSVEFHTRAGGKARGEHYELIIFDESQFLTGGQVSAVTPTTATYEDAQIWYAGTPEPLESSATRGHTAGNVTGGVFRRIRRDILFKEKDYSCFFEWGVDRLVHKGDKKWWYRTNPSLGFKPSEGRGLTEKSFIADSLADEEFVVERLGFWSSQDRKSVIDAGSWASLEISDSEVSWYTNPRVHDDVILAIKSDPVYDTVTVAFGFVKGERVFVRVADSFSLDSDWVDSVTEIVVRMVDYKGCFKILIDGTTAQALLVQSLRRRGKWARGKNVKSFGKIELMSSGDVKSSAATFVSAVASGSVVHSGQPQVNAAIHDAQKRTRGDTWWGFSSISGKSRPELIEALSLVVLGFRDGGSVGDFRVAEREKELGYKPIEWRSI